MDAQILKDAFSADPQITSAAAKAVRQLAVEARHETRCDAQRMNEQVQLGVARAMGATVQLQEPVCAD